MKTHDGTVAGEVLDVSTRRVRPLAGQPRAYFAKSKLDALAGSIAELGQLTAIQVVRLPTGGDHDYELIDGERRLRVFRDRGWPTIRAEVKAVESAAQHWVQSFVANMGREDYAPMEVARGVHRLSLRQPYNTMPRSECWAAIGRVCGRSPAWVQSHICLMNLDPAVQRHLEPDAETPLASSLAMVIAREVPAPKQPQVAKYIVESGIGGARARLYIRQATGTPMGKGRGLGGGVRGRRPSDDVAIAFNAAQRLETALDVINSIPKSTFDRFAQSAGQKKIKALASRLRRSQRELDVVADALERLAKKPRSAPPAPPIDERCK